MYIYISVFTYLLFLFIKTGWRWGIQEYGLWYLDAVVSLGFIGLFERKVLIFQDIKPRLYVLIMSRTRFRVNPHSIVA